MNTDLSQLLPEDASTAVLVGRVWDPDTGGPRPVAIDAAAGQARDLFDLAPTVAELIETYGDELAVTIRGTVGSGRSWALDDLVAGTIAGENDASVARLLSPVDLQVIKACGVTFADSMIERVIEERCAGDPERAAEIRGAIGATLDDAVGSIEPGTAEAAKVKEVLQEKGLWSQYLEVGLGPDPEVFTKAPVLSSVGPGARIGIPAFSAWNNPEPELVLAVDAGGIARGALLGNDVNLRDVEGRSALLLGMAKDNNASAALGPFIRLFDGHFTLDDVREERITLRIEGADGYILRGENDVSRLSRSFERLIAATRGPHHQYPDGFVLYTGTLFAPTQDRGKPGQGFTHQTGDRVAISSPHLGTLTNIVGRTEELPPWNYGIRHLHTYLRAQSSAPVT